MNVEWGGAAKDIASSVLVGADLHLTPTGQPRRGARSNIPVSGAVIAKYNGASQVVNIQTVSLQTPATHLEANGTLGVNNGDPLTNLQLNLQASDLGEFDSVLQTLASKPTARRVARRSQLSCTDN